MSTQVHVQVPLTPHVLKPNCSTLDAARNQSFQPDWVIIVVVGGLASGDPAAKAWVGVGSIVAALRTVASTRAQKHVPSLGSMLDGDGRNWEAIERENTENHALTRLKASLNMGNGRDKYFKAGIGMITPH